MTVLPRAASWMWMVVVGQILLVTLSSGAKPELLAAVLLPALLLAMPFLRGALTDSGRAGGEDGGLQDRVRDLAEDVALQQRTAKGEVLRPCPAQQCTLEQERERIARDLHDDLGQTLTALKLDLGSFLESQPPLAATRRQRLERAISTADVGLAQVNSIVGNLRPSLLKHAGFLDAARWCVQDADERLQAEVRLKVGDGADHFLPEETAVALYRMLQESLTNVAKHAGATQVEVRYEVVGSRVILCIEDNGCGFDLERVQKKQGYGLLGMRERAEGLGGYCTVQTRPELGCSITIVVPLHHEKIRLLLADDHAVVREGLRAVFAAQADMEVVAEPADGDEALAQAVRHQPDVLLMDLSMPGCNGRQLIQNLHRRAGSVAVLVVSMHREEQYAAPMIRAGAKGFVTKTRSPRELVEATRKVAEGGVFISRELADRIAFSSVNPASAEKAERLSCREQEILVAHRAECDGPGGASAPEPQDRQHAQDPNLQKAGNEQPF